MSEQTGFFSVMACKRPAVKYYARLCKGVATGLSGLCLKAWREKPAWCTGLWGGGESERGGEVERVREVGEGDERSKRWEIKGRPLLVLPPPLPASRDHCCR